MYEVLNITLTLTPTPTPTLTLSRCVLFTCTPLMLVQPGYLLWYAMYKLYLTESCGRALMKDDVCPEVRWGWG